MDLEALERRIRRLEDLEEIKQLKARYAAYCDANYDADALAALFTADAVWDGGMLGRSEGREAIRQFFRGSSQRISFAIHNILSPIIDITGETATGTWYLLQTCTYTNGNQAVLGAATYHDRATLDSSVCPAATGTMTPCTWDSNADGAMWVRAQATVGTESRTVVALVKLELVAEQFPQNTITAGKFRTSNSGNKVIVDTKGCAAVGAPPGGCKSQRAAPVVVRCAASPPYTRSGSCVGFDQNKGQVSPPDSIQTGFSGRAVPVNAIDDFRRRAKAIGTYYASGCPSSLTGPVVFIENGNCSFTGGTFNSDTAPGLVVVRTGTLSLGGNVTYYGTIYAANENPSPTDSGDVVSLGGTATIQGAVVIEGLGGLLAGSSKLNVVYDPGASANLYGYGTSAEISQNTFRELPAGQ